MSFGSFLADAAFGLAVALVVGALLDGRKRRWKGRSARPGPSAQSPYATPGYQGDLRRRGGPGKAP